ncbi:MAG: folate family ECF transporter S component [Synergistetes bacterium]|nr:folate family ECF transporter S component [Synergistota bacterium]
MRKSRRLAILGFMIALSVVLSRFGSVRIAIGGVEGIRVGFGSFPLIFLGIFLGPVEGAIGGALADIIGYIISPMGPYMPHFTLTSALRGFIPGITVILFKRFSFTWRVTVALIASTIVPEITLLPYFLYILFGIPWKVVLVSKLIGSGIQFPVYLLLFNILYRRIPLVRRLEEGMP